MRGAIVCLGRDSYMAMAALGDGENTRAGKVGEDSELAVDGAIWPLCGQIVLLLYHLTPIRAQPRCKSVLRPDNVGGLPRLPCPLQPGPHRTGTQETTEIAEAASKAHSALPRSSTAHS
jgi:hypothetical protein